MRVRWRRIVFFAGVAGGFVLLGGALWLSLELRASLARLDGVARLPGVGAAVEVERDSLGIPRLVAASLEDVLRAQGFVHAQERFFQMDLYRRMAAGELAELVGPAAVETDRRMRPFLGREVAEAMLARAEPRHRRWLEAYAAGVEAGLADLGAAPPEYVVLRATPEPWRPADCLLVYLTLYRGQTLNAPFEETAGVMQATLPAPLFEFLTPDTTEADRPSLLGADGDPRAGYEPLPVPGPEVVDLRTLDATDVHHDAVSMPFDRTPGSNAWVVSGAHTASGRALLANDPHLGLSVPNTWFRNELRWDGGFAAGASLPGVPGIAIGSNGDVAWGFTNAMADQEDWVVIDTDPEDPTRYRVPEGWEHLERRTETIAVRGAEAIELELYATRWGFVTKRDWQGRPLVLRWVPTDAARVDASVLDLIRSTSVDEALEVLHRFAGPGFNALLADANGHIAWTVTGYLPRRRGFDGKVPVSWAAGDVGWDGQLTPDERPGALDPPGGVVWSANDRSCPPELARRITRVWLSPERAARAAERLETGGPFTAADMLALQLDTRSSVHDLYAELALAIDADAFEEGHPARHAREHVAAWSGRADADDPGFRIVRAFRHELHRRILAPLIVPCVEADELFVYDWPLMEEPVRRILAARPAHLLPPGNADWDAVVAHGFRATAERLAARDDLDAPWGAVSRVEITHPFGGVPGLSRWLDMPREPLPGHATCLRAADTAFGASLRMVVSPSNEDEGLAHMPCGQSGHFLSPHYADQQAAWLHGDPTPFAAGPTEYRMRLADD